MELPTIRWPDAALAENLMKSREEKFIPDIPSTHADAENFSSIHEEPLEGFGKEIFQVQRNYKTLLSGSPLIF